jgi:thiol-disulfide isomerase/thioredoxin/Flp pilus assembly protein TadD
MKATVIYVGVAIVLLLAACSTAPKEPTARAYADPPELTACNDSLEAYASSAGPAANYEGYKAIYEYFIQKFPSSTELHRDFQSLFDGFEKDDEKLAYYKKLYDQNSTSALCSYLYGRALSNEDAEKLFRRAVELDPNYYWGNFGLASRLLSSTPPDTDGAIASYRKCIEIDNAFPAAFETMTNIYNARKDYANALKFVDLLAVTSPDQFRPISLKADILIAKGDSTAAESAFKDYAGKNSKDEAVRKKLVQLCRDQERYSEALTYQWQLVGLTKKPGDALFDLAKIFAMAGQNDSAMAALTDASTKGFADYRRLSRNPLFEPIRSLPAFDSLSKSLQATAEKARAERLASLKDNIETQKQEALAAKLDLAAPLFSFKNLEGKTVALADLKGKIVVIDFWATWCGPCRMTMPLLQEFVDGNPKDVEFLSINVWENDTSLVRPFLVDYGYEFNVLFGDRDITNKYQVSGIPTLFVIDKNGVIRYKHVGYDVRADQLLAWQTEALL